MPRGAQVVRGAARDLAVGVPGVDGVVGRDADRQNLRGGAVARQLEVVRRDVGVEVGGGADADLAIDIECVDPIGMGVEVVGGPDADLAVGVPGVDAVVAGDGDLDDVVRLVAGRKPVGILRAAVVEVGRGPGRDHAVGVPGVDPVVGGDRHPADRLVRLAGGEPDVLLAALAAEVGVAPAAVGELDVVVLIGARDEVDRRLRLPVGDRVGDALLLGQAGVDGVGDDAAWPALAAAVDPDRQWFRIDGDP